ncbi:MAG TPA: discoidin domain-containing protein [Gemmatimonadales bacterium]
MTIDTTSRLNTFDPRRDWGAALDGHDAADIPRIYTPGNIAAMLGAGFGPITYRLRTELGIETWHWNPRGRWSDPAHHQGYWISDSKSPQPIRISYGYRLPRRGRTIDDANNDGYSRIDDGDTTTFWKTNPYLDPRYTGDAESEHPQWFTIDLGRAQPVNGATFLWGDPYPRSYVVDYWDGDQTQPIDYNPDGRWREFPSGTISDGRGGSAALALSDTPITTRFVRVVMSQSSHTAAHGNGDPRDSAGFALREVYIGERAAAGSLRDAVHHDMVAATQSAVLVSSTDPWHRATDIDSSTAQPGFDLLFGSGLTNQRPVFIPTGLLFDTPENAAAELAFLRSRHDPIAGIELGEEPDGQRVTPEDYGALYLQFAAALHRVDPAARLGGPSWQDLLDDPLYIWPDREAPGNRPTPLGRLLDYLAAHRRSADYRFLSFEWYPFDDVCDDPADNLAAAPGMLAAGLARLKVAGLPDSIPMVMTEYGYSAHLSTAEVTIPAALFDADLMGNFFAHGGSQAFYFGYEPGDLSHEPACEHWGNLVMLLADSNGQARDRMPRFYSAWLLTHAWADSAGGSHIMHPARLSRDGSPVDDTLLSVYALHRPDQRWSILVVNRDSDHARSIAVALGGGRNGASRALRGPLDLWQYSEAQYHFQEKGEFGHPTLDLPPLHRVESTPSVVTVPAYSITVVTGQ